MLKHEIRKVKFELKATTKLFSVIIYSKNCLKMSLVFLRLLSLKSFTSISISYDSSILTSSSIYFFTALLYTSFREMAKKIVITNVKAPTPKNMY